MNKLFIAGGVAAVALAAKLAYEKFFNAPQVVAKQVVIKKLIDMKEYLYPILFEIANIVSAKLTPQGVPPDQAKMFIMQSDQLAFKQNIAAILNQKVYYDIDQSTLQYAIENTYQDDKQVQFYKKSFKEQYEKCFLGIQPEALSTRMLILNKQTLLTICSSLLESNILFVQLKDKLKKLKLIVDAYQHEITMRQLTKQKVMEKFEAFLMKDESQDDKQRHQLLKKHKIEDVKTFEFAIAKFLKQSQDFKTQYEKIQAQFKDNVVELLKKCQ